MQLQHSCEIHMQLASNSCVTHDPSMHACYLVAELYCSKCLLTGCIYSRVLISSQKELRQFCKFIGRHHFSNSPANPFLHPSICCIKSYTPIDCLARKKFKSSRRTTLVAIEVLYTLPNLFTIYRLWET